MDLITIPILNIDDTIKYHLVFIVDEFYITDFEIYQLYISEF